MKLRELTVVGTLLVPAAAHGGGMFLPGAGATSTARAGAAVASVDDGEALVVNPAGLANTKGTTITIGASLIHYGMKFSRAGTYDASDENSMSDGYEGTPFETVENDVSPQLGIGSVQPVPVITIATDLGGRLGKLRLAAGLYAPNAYPFRDMSNGYVFNGDFTRPPPATRYDVITQSAAVIMPSLAASYRILPNLDVGVRLSWGYAEFESKLALWGLPNVEENVMKDATLEADVQDTFVPAGGIGVMWRPTPNLEFGAQWSSWMSLQTKGSAKPELGPEAGVPGSVTTIEPVEDELSRCERGGTPQNIRLCVGLALPMTATVGGRYKFLDEQGALKGDIELDVGWENWGKTCDFIKDPDCTSPGQYRVVTDAKAVLDGDTGGGTSFQDAIIDHGFRDTWSFKLGGSYHLPQGANRIILRGGVGYETGAAKDGWLRVDVDGAARYSGMVGAAYRMQRVELNIGGGYIYQGKNTNDGTCNPTPPDRGCRADGSENPIENRNGPDPESPLVPTISQLESPFNQGTLESNYVLFMIGMSTWF